MRQFVSPKKSLGQHFLSDKNIARKIAGSLTGHGQYTKVLEIGPGTGILSEPLMADKRFEWYGLDIDRESIAYLREAYPAYTSKIIHDDFLTFDFKALFEGKAVGIIGNFPYNISTQIMFRVLEYREHIPEVVGMFQKEVARRIASPPGSKEYGILSVLVQAFYDVTILFQVDPHVFIPPPRVQSAVIRCRLKENHSLGCEVNHFYLVVKTAFNQRRKTLRNSIKSLGVNWEMLPPHLAGERPERLGVEEFVQIASLLG